MLQTDILIWITSLQTSFFDSLAGILTFLGNEDFYFLILPLIYWCFSKEIGFRLLYIFGFSMYMNSLLKIKAAVSRPVGVEGVHSIFIESASVGSHYPHDSFPSGHAQGSTTLWGYLAYRLHHPLLWMIALLLIISISLSRIYTGLHWPTDVLGGILLAVLLLVISIKIDRFVSKQSLQIKWLLALVFPFLLAFLFPHDEGLKLSGFLLGVGIAYLLEARYVRFETSQQLWKLPIIYFLGLAGMLALQLGLKLILPAIPLSEFLRYGAIGLWGVFLAPWLFVKCKLFSTSTMKQDPTQPPVSL